ncbi:MAG TPA: transcriptional regulator, partial [Blastocatellia bacterium]|nr:transcriptional regulator [Blastocatellia bacterium]
EYPEPNQDGSNHAIPKSEYADIVIPFQIKTPYGLLTFFSTTTIFGTPIEVTLSELAIESFFPADAQTSDIMRTLLTSHR